MKKLVFLFFLLFSISVFAQEPVYTPMKGNYKFKGIKVDSLFLVPSFTDTTAANATYLDGVAGAMIRCGNDFWMRNADASSWLQNVNIGNGVSPVLSFVNEVFKKTGTDSVFYIVAPHDTFFAFKDMGVDTMSLSARINTKIDNIKRSSDSVYYSKNGFWLFAYKDSLGQPINFANSNLRATGNRTHSFANNSLTIDSVSQFNVYSKTISKIGNLQNYNGELFLNSSDLNDGSISILDIYKDSIFLGGEKFGERFGFKANADDGKVSLNRAGNIAFLPMNNFGIDTLALKSDITGGGQNFANADLNATGNRTHNFKGYTLNLDSASSILMKTQTYSGDNQLYVGDGGGGLYIDKSSKFWGIDYSADFDYLMLRNKSNNAYLSRKPFGTDTLALLSNIKPDGPDRINGDATGNIFADMSGNAMNFSKVKTFTIADTIGISGGVYIDMDSIRIGKYPNLIISKFLKFKDFNNTFLEIDTLGNAFIGNKEKDSLYMKLDKSSEIFFLKTQKANTWEDWKGNKSQIQTSLAKNNIDISTANDTIYVPGMYVILDADGTGTYRLNLPDAADWDGQSITLLSQTGSPNAYIDSPSAIKDRQGNTITYLAHKDFITFYSDGSNWLGHYSQ